MLAALRMWSSSVLAGITQVLLQSSWKKAGTLRSTAGSWEEDGNITRLARWPVSTSTPTVKCTLANKVLQVIWKTGEKSWADRLCYRFETAMLQLICSSYIQHFCFATNILYNITQVSSDHSFLIPSPSTAFVCLYCKGGACTKHKNPPVPSGNMPGRQTHLNTRSKQAVLTWHLTWLRLAKRKHQSNNRLMWLYCFSCLS